MNYVAISGNLGRDPEVRYNNNGLCIARYSLAVRRRFAKEGEQDTDWLNVVAFGKSGEFAEKYFRKGQKVIVEGRLQTGSYEKDGIKHYTTDIIVEHQEFCESKGAKAENNEAQEPEVQPNEYGFYDIPDGIEE